MLPGEDGFSLAETMMERAVPVLFLTAKTAVSDRVRGLRMGAEDYMLKPFEPEELLARVENILRRTRKARTHFVFGALVVDLPSRRVTKGEREVALTALEFDLLAMLVRRSNVALSREALLSGVWGYAYQGETRTVDAVSYTHLDVYKRQIQDIPWHKRMLNIIIPIQKTSIMSGYLLPFITCVRELTLFMLLCSQTKIITTMLDYFDEMGLYAFSSGINLILIVFILICNALINKLTGASLDKGIGGE